MEDKPAQACIRQPGHDGPCNGFPRKECEVIAELTRQRDEALGKWGVQLQDFLGIPTTSGDEGTMAVEDAIHALTARVEAAEREMDEAISFRHNMDHANKIQQENYAKLDWHIAEMRSTLVATVSFIRQVFGPKYDSEPSVDFAMKLINQDPPK